MLHLLDQLDPLSPMRDQDRISPCSIKTMSSGQKIRIKKISIWGLSVDPLPNSPN